MADALALFGLLLLIPILGALCVWIAANSKVDIPEHPPEERKRPELRVVPPNLDRSDG